MWLEWIQAFRPSGFAADEMRILFYSDQSYLTPCSNYSARKAFVGPTLFYVM